MKKLQLIVLFFWFIATSGFSQEFYDINTINTIEIEFEEENWNQILHQLVANGLDERLMGLVIINGVSYDSVGVRYKGNSSYSPNRVKNPLNIKLDYIIDDQTLDGYGSLKLSNGFKDPSLVRETLGYEIVRKYLPASLSNYANVYINGLHLGLYTSNQDVDNFFGRMHLGVSDKVRVKGEMSGPNQGVWKYLGADSAIYTSQYQLESDYGWSKLVNFIDTLNNYNEHVENVLNVDRLLWMLAYDILLVNLDAPVNMPQNYYLFEDVAGRFNIIPWDLNETFGVFASVAGGQPLNLYQLQTLDPFFNINNVNYPIINKILNNQRYKRSYIAHMKTILEELFASGWYLERALEIQAIIDQAVQNDPNKLYTYEQFLNNIHNTVGGGPPPNQMPVPGITQVMETRIQFLNNHQWFQAIAPEITNIEYSPELINAGDEIWINAQVENATLAELAYRSENSPVFQRVPMFDDGSHHDGLAGDGIFGVSVIAGYTEIIYYIFAENSVAASFSPERAEYEFYKIPVLSGLVINEFMANNVSVVSDQDGDYDDWIELFNNGTEAINLEGYFLSDKLDQPDKWAFPDTTISPGGFLIVWADEDLEQVGLHADFKLSKSGESIILSNPELEAVDVLTFGQQQTDISTGRFPNGTGEFILMIPTFGEENVDILTNGDEPAVNSHLSMEVFPNPFENSLCITFAIDQNAQISLVMMNLFGQSKMIINNLSLPSGTHKYQIETTTLHPGLWIVRLVANGRINDDVMVKAIKCQTP